MGTIYIAAASIFRKLGAEVIVPPYTSKKTLSLGTKHSPEAICLPYKLVLGNYIEAIESGAEAIVMISSPGICRLGEYSKSIKQSLDDLGYNVKCFDLDLYKGKFAEMYRCIKSITGNHNIIDIARSINLCVNKVFVIDELDSILSYYRAREINVGQAERAYMRGLKWVDEALTSKQLKKAKKDAVKEIKKTDIDTEREILHVDLTGEIFMVLDAFSNQNLERELGKLGVETRRALNMSGWIKTALVPKIFRKEPTHLERSYKYAKPYLSRDIGGDALESVGDVIHATESGADGIIHISPFTCMPEIMSQNIFPTMRQDGTIPILSLVLDEQTGKAGYVTRLEAFVDLMRRRKRLGSVTVQPI
ncbi:MAG: acyl-CoA dehydratase activase-related protein [bacterium]